VWQRDLEIKSTAMHRCVIPGASARPRDARCGRYEPSRRP
jgi:hypothetical protein